MSNLGELQDAYRKNKDELARLERQKRNKEITQNEYEQAVNKLQREYKIKTDLIISNIKH